MLTTLVPTTVVRTAMTTTMSFDAFHSVATLARFHGQNFTSAWLKAFTTLAKPADGYPPLPSGWTESLGGLNSNELDNSALAETFW